MRSSYFSFSLFWDLASRQSFNFHWWLFLNWQSQAGWFQTHRSFSGIRHCIFWQRIILSLFFRMWETHQLNAGSCSMHWAIVDVAIWIGCVSLRSNNFPTKWSHLSICDEFLNQTLAFSWLTYLECDHLIPFTWGLVIFSLIDKCM